MLLHLAIRDFAIVDTLDLEFSAGFTALTGETGAGKSILIDALALALGERADAAAVRSGAERAEVVAEFDIDRVPAAQAWLQEAALEGDAGSVIVRRVVDKSGRSRAFINGTATTVQQLALLSDLLVDIHGQHAHQSLLKSEAQRVVLDSHAGLAPLAEETAAAWREWQRLAKARAEYETHSAARDAEREALRWQLEELEKLRPAPDEWEKVQAEQSRLAHAASLLEGAHAALEALTESEAAAAGALSAASSRLRPLTSVDSALREPLELLEAVEAQVHEAAHALKRYVTRVELDPERLGEVERRLEALHAAGRKHRVPPQSLPQLLDDKRQRLAELDQVTDPEALAAQEQAARERYALAAAKLSKERNHAAARLAKEVTAGMLELAMTGARFEVALRALDQGSVHGNEAVEFLVAANPGSEARPLGRVASGGELSRISLAIQVITSKAAAVPTLIFDEVDAGIGGAVAEVVGRKLRSLGRERQTLCVTHLPQVAAQADRQWSVLKKALNGEVRSEVLVLEGAARIEELARMLGGVQITATTRKHAAELLARRT